MPNCKHGIDSRFCSACASPVSDRERRRTAVQRRAETRAPANDAEREAYEAVYAYEEARSKQKGKTIRASRTWPMVDEYGIIGTVERIVMRADDAAGYRVLVEMGMEDMAFEAVVLRHPDVFSREAVQHSQLRLQRLNPGTSRSRG
jgi:hypothetical protein